MLSQRFGCLSDNYLNSLNRAPSLPRAFRKGDQIKLDLIAPGRVHGKMLAIANSRVIGVLTDKPVGSRVSAGITRTDDNVYVAKTGN